MLFASERVHDLQDAKDEYAHQEVTKTASGGVDASSEKGLA